MRDIFGTKYIEKLKVAKELFYFITIGGMQSFRH